jgi:deoxyribonuclease-4
MTDVFTIGCHLSIARGFAAAARDAVSIGANTFQFFTRNPRGGKAKAIDPADLAEFRSIAAEQGITRVLAHAPYTLNPASATERTRVFAREVLADDLQRMEQVPGQLYNMHPGSHVGQGTEAGIDLIADALNSALEPSQTTTLLLETMAGKGTEVGRSFEELRDIIERIELQDHVGVCLDTCHVWDAGYDLAHLDDVLEQFDRVLGIERLRAIHLNDSKNPLASHKDRHEQIGRGCIGLEALTAVVNHPQLRALPFFLETPHDALSGYAGEIALLKQARSEASSSAELLS